MIRGERIWERSIGGTRTPGVVGDYIFMINARSELICLTRKYGQVVWVKKLPTHPEMETKVMWTGPLVAGGKLYLVGAQGTFMILNPSDGSLLKTQELGAPTSLPPLVAGDMIYMLTDNGDVLAFRSGPLPAGGK
jgi:outer membrane protein assembly factor BamB